ncbi:MAG: hypothetical protein ACKODH_02630, partial [Limisphaerales bacterium]
MQVRTPQMKWLASLFKAPEVSPEQQADRIRFMERDVCLTIKVIVLSALAYVFLSNWLEGVSTMGELGIETLRGSFRAYVAANVIIGAMLLAMDYLPVAWVQWSVFVLNIVDGTFVALLTLITGGLESTIYWVFLVLVIRNAVSITRVRLQITANFYIILCYLFAGFLDFGTHELRRTQEAVETALERTDSAVRGERQLRLALDNVIRRLREERNPALRSELEAKRKELTETIATRTTGASTNKLAPMQIDSDPEQFADTNHITTLVLLALYENPRLSQSVVNRVLLLLLLTLSCYGINVLADLQLQAQEEAREFAIRQEQLRSTGRLAAEIAHQLKNPLAIINNAAFSLQKSLGDAKPAALQQLEMIREEITR